MLLLVYLGLLAHISTALPTQQVIGPAATLTGIPATNHILILTPQAQVQLESSLKYPQTLVQHLSPIARVDSPTDQTIVYYPNENLINALPKSNAQSKQIESANITNIVNQFVSAGQTAQAQLEAFQQQLSQGLEGLIQPVGGEKTEPDAEIQALKPTLPTGQLVESFRQDGRRFYSLSNIPQFYSNIEVIHTPISPLFVVPQLQAIRARSVSHPDGKTPIRAAQISTENENLARIAVQGGNLDAYPKPLNIDNQARSSENEEVPASKAHVEPIQIKNDETLKDNNQLQSNLHSSKYLSSLENNAALREIQQEQNKKEVQSIRTKEQANNSELVSFAEALPSGLAISGDGGLSLTKPIASAVVGKDGIAYSAPSGTAIAGSSNGAQSYKLP